MLTQSSPLNILEEYSPAVKIDTEIKFDSMTCVNTVLFNLYISFSDLGELVFSLHLDN